MTTDLAERLRTLRLDWPESRDRPAGFDSPAANSTAIRSSPLRPRLLAAAAAAIVLLAAFGYWLTMRTAAPPAQQPQAVQAAAGRSAPPPAGISASGHVVARRSATVSSLVTGQVDRILVQEGQAVAAGQLLATLDNQAAVAARDGALAAARASQARTGALAAEIGEAEREVGRLTALHQRGFVADALLSRQQASLARLRAQLGAAQAEVGVAAANVRAASTTSEQHLVRAPFPGIVSAINAQPGEIVSPISAGGGFTRTGICTIIDLDSIEVEVNVAEALISRIRVGMPAFVTLKAFPNRRYQARVSAIVPVADRSRGSFGVRLEIADRDERMLPEMAADVEFQTENAQ